MTSTQTINSLCPPFGMVMPGRNWQAATASGYGFGFQGQIMDKEIWGNAISYKFRISDPRIGRFLSVDPLTTKYPQWSPYQFAGNQVIASEELEGAEPKVDLNPNVSLNLTLGANPSLRTSVTLTGSVTGVNYQVKTDASFSLYYGGLGTSSNEKKLQYDVTGAITGTVGTAGVNVAPLPQYILNSNTRSGVDNEFRASISYGQIYNLNSAIQNSTGNGYTRLGLVSLRIPTSFGGFIVTTNNDVSIYGGGGTDQGWTGMVITSWNTKQGPVDAGYECFTGVALKRGANPSTTKIGNRPYYVQTEYQASLNKSSTFLRTPNSFVSSNTYSDGWLQHGIHDSNSFSNPKGIWSPLLKQTPRFMYLNPDLVVK